MIKHIINKFSCVLGAAVLAAGTVHAIDTAQPALIPQPQSVQWHQNTAAVGSIKISLPKSTDEPERRARVVDLVKEVLDTNGVTVDQQGADYALKLVLGNVDAPHQKEEAYRLISTAKGTQITANTWHGLLHGARTFSQLMVSNEGKASVALATINDYPAFPIRGYMHDVGRNFQSIDLLKMQVDVLAAYKFNVFHWHLTDHFGWRLESKIHPGLQEDRAFGRGVGKFYTQKEFVDMVNYCWARGITVIPEFDSPGHSEAFRHGLEIPNMKDPRAIKAMVELIDEICALVPAERMPYIHLGTDEVRHKDEYVDGNYLPTLHKAVKKNDRTVIGWIKGMTVKGDTDQIQQTWASCKPVGHLRHIDSRSNYVNHMEALDVVLRMLFQQPCRVPHVNDKNLGGILAYWPDVRVDDENKGLSNSPVLLSMIAYSEAVWKGIEQDQRDYWAKVPAKGTPEYEAYSDFEHRIAEHRDRFFAGKPLQFVRSAHIPWKMLGPVAGDEIDVAALPAQDVYETEAGPYRWANTVHGGAIHVKHFFGFPGHLKSFPKGKDAVWARTFIHSDKDQTLDAWISFNTTSTSDNRAGSTVAGQWNANALCDIWINRERVSPPEWRNPGKGGKEIAFTDDVYTSRAPSKITLKKGWNEVLIRSASSWKWVFSFSPIQMVDGLAREVPGLMYSAELPDKGKF